MASKFKKEIGQPEISSFIRLSDSEIIKDNPERTNKRKDITPPSSEKPRKKKHHSPHQTKYRQPKMPDTKKPDLSHPKSDNDDSSEEEEVTEEESAFERRLTKSLSKLMRKELWTVKEDVKALRAGQEKHNKIIKDLVTMKQESKALKLKCE